MGTLLGDGKSSVRLFGTSDTTSWYHIWEAVMLVYSVCVRQGRGGSVKGLGMFRLFVHAVGTDVYWLGDHGNLFITMTAKTGSLSNLTQAEDVNFD